MAKTFIELLLEVLPYHLKDIAPCILSYCEICSCTCHLSSDIVFNCVNESCKQKVLGIIYISNRNNVPGMYQLEASLEPVIQNQTDCKGKTKLHLECNNKKMKHHKIFDTTQFSKNITFNVSVSSNSVNIYQLISTCDCDESSREQTHCNKVNCTQFILVTSHLWQ